jgi:hypothetical protein
MFGCRPRLPAFAPVSVVGTAAAPERPPIPAKPVSGVIEIEFAGGTRVRVTGTVEASALASVIAALAERR